MTENDVYLENVIMVRDMERIISDFPGVEETAVLVEELPDGRKEFIAYVQLDGSCAVEKEALADHCRRKMDVPLRIEFCELPKTATGKVARHLLKQASGQ